MPPISLSTSVGKGGANKAADVRQVKDRLAELGFDWITTEAGAGPLTIKAIQLFQAIKNGFQTVDRPQNDGLVEPGGLTLAWLNAVNAPRWIKMPAGSPAEGYVNFERADSTDDHDFGASWLADTLAGAGRAYLSTHLSTHPAALMRVNDASLPHGGKTPDHATHQTGLCCDLLLPRTDGKAIPTVFTSPTYDRAAARAMILALLAQPLALRILFNDPVLVGEHLCTEVDGHHNHMHYDIQPPPRQAAVVAVPALSLTRSTAKRKRR